MTGSSRPCVSVVDYGLGNVFSVKHACEAVGLSPRLTSEPAALRASRAVILPGVGAFGDAMQALRARGLVDELRGLASDGMRIFGICLGMQLLFDESEEHGIHQGLGLVPGRVVHLGEPGTTMRIPHVGWVPVHPTKPGAWQNTNLAPVQAGTPFYFVHSYHVIPNDPACEIATSQFGARAFCAAVQKGRIFGAQFHPERSGLAGLRVYQALTDTLSQLDADFTPFVLEKQPPPPSAEDRSTNAT